MSFNKVMAAIEPESMKEKGDFWFSNFGFPLEDKYRPIYEKYYAERKTSKDIKGKYIVVASWEINANDNVVFLC